MPIAVDLIVPTSDTRLGERLQKELLSDEWRDLRAAIAFVTRGGVRHLAASLDGFLSRAGCTACVTVGIDQQGSSVEGVQMLWQVLTRHGSKAYVLHNPSSSPSTTFHPKLWLFNNDRKALLISGSGNLTGGGLFTNYEFNTAITLDLSSSTDWDIFSEAQLLLNRWSDSSEPDVVTIGASVLTALHESGELPSEQAMRSTRTASRAAGALASGVEPGQQGSTNLFSRSTTVRGIPAPPALPDLGAGVVQIRDSRSVTVSTPKDSRRSSEFNRSARSNGNASRDFLAIEINPRNKTEIFLAKRLLQEVPEFFGWPFHGRTVPKNPKNPGQPQPEPLPTATVKVYSPTGAVVGDVIDPELKLWTYTYGPSANDDFRLTLKGGLIKKVPDGSILKMTRYPVSGYDYDIEIFPAGCSQYGALRPLLTETLPGGRQYGWGAE